MGATLLDLSMLHDEDLVGVFDGAESMGDNDNGLLSCVDQLVKRLLYLMLALCVQG